MPNTEPASSTSAPTIPTEINASSLPPHAHIHFVVEEVVCTCTEKSVTIFRCECGKQHTEVADTTDHTPGAPSCTPAVKRTACGEIPEEADCHIMSVLYVYCREIGE